MKRSLKEMRALLEAATPGPWTWQPTGMAPECMAKVNIMMCHNRTPYVDHGNAAFIAAAPEMVADLLGVVEELRDALIKIGGPLDWHIENYPHEVRYCVSRARESLAKLDADGAGGEG